MAGPGDHIRLGNAELSPGLAVGSEYRSNVYLSEVDEVAGVNVNASPFVGLKLTNENLVLGAQGAYHLKKYLDPSLANLDRFNNVSADVDASILPHSNVGVDLSESFAIASRPSEAESAEDANITKLTNDLKALLAFHPGSALDVRLGGSFGVQDIKTPPEASIDNDARYNTRVGYGPVLNGRWKFFPRTSVVFQSSAEWFDWGSNLVDINEEVAGISSPDTVYGSYLAVPDGWTWRFETGLTGRVTQKVALNVVVGYGQMLYDSQSVIDAAAAIGDVDAAELAGTVVGFDKNVSGSTGFLANVIVKYNPVENHQVSLGYRKDFSDSYFTNYMAYNYVYAKYDAQLGDSLGFTGVGGYRFEDFEGEITRQDHFVRVRGDVNYAITKWSKIGAGARWDRRASADRMHPEAEYDDVQIHGELTVAY